MVSLPGDLTTLANRSRRLHTHRVCVGRDWPARGTKWTHLISGDHRAILARAELHPVSITTNAVHTGDLRQASSCQHRGTVGKPRITSMPRLLRSLKLEPKLTTGHQQSLDQASDATFAALERRRPSPRRDWAGSTFVKMVDRPGVEPGSSGSGQRLNQPPYSLRTISRPRNPGPPTRDRGGSTFYKMVGAPGFEPGTSPTRTARATRLRHAPTQTEVSHTSVANSGRVRDGRTRID
jgi:hypothetical protein